MSTSYPLWTAVSSSSHCAAPVNGRALSPSCRFNPAPPPPAPPPRSRGPTSVCAAPLRHCRLSASGLLRFAAASASQSRTLLVAVQRSQAHSGTNDHGNERQNDDDRTRRKLVGVAFDRRCFFLVRSSVSSLLPTGREANGTR